MKAIIGDLIKLAKEGKFDVIIHGCNCFCTMGAGIAKSIKQEFPEAYKADLKTKKGDIAKLGSYTFGDEAFDNIHLRVVNAYTQYHYRGKMNVSYAAVKTVFRKIKLDFSGERIGYPKIGAGLAGGDWNIISKIIETELEGEDHTLVKR